MASIADGSYIIHNASNVDLVLDKQWNDTVNGTNIWLYTRNLTDAQKVRVYTATDGTRRLIFHDCGKAVDVSNALVDVAGTNIQLWDDNDTGAQAVSINDAGTTATFDGNTYGCFRIAWSSGLVATAEASASEANIALHTAAALGNRLDEWFFEPIPQIISGGVYRILSKIDPQFCLEVAGNSVANAANVHLGKYNGKNHQLWQLESEEDGGMTKWAIRSLSCDRYMDVEGAGAADYTNVQVYDDNDTRAQRWRLWYGQDITIDGKPYKINRLGSFVTNDGNTYYLDVRHAEGYANTNVQIFTNNGTDAQAFILVPTEAEDPTMPTPYDLSLALEIGGQGKQYQLSSQYPAYAKWRCSSAWAADGNKHYEYRTRVRTMNSTTGAWDPWYGVTWNSWTNWTTAYVRKIDQDVWLAEGMSINIETPITASNSDRYKNQKRAQIELQVRCCGGSETLVHGKAVDAVFDVYIVPQITFTAATLCGEGLRLDWTTDYTHGMNYVTVKSIRSTRTNETLLDFPTRLSSGLNPGYDVIPMENFKALPGDGDPISIEYQVGYDQMTCIPDRTYFDGLPVSYDAGNTSITPRFEREGLDYYAVIPYYQWGKSGCWVATDGGAFECENGRIVQTAIDPDEYEIWYNLPYPMLKPFGVFAETKNQSGSVWGTSYTECDALDAITHAWSFNGKTCYLHKFEGSMPITQASYQAVYESDLLDNRKHESLSFTDATRGSFTATGALIHDEDYSTFDDFKELLNAHHAVYRDINGGVRYVGITGLSVTRYEIYDVVSVTMSEETI